MNVDEETFLTAYLDGALDSEQRDRVESAVLSDPVLAEHLRDLGRVRDLVSGLPRPGLQVDLSSRVLARLNQPAPRPGLLGRPAGRAAVLLATAATLLVVASVTFISTSFEQGLLAYARRVLDPAVPRPVEPSVEPGSVAATVVADASSTQVKPEPIAPQPAVTPKAVETVVLGPDDAERRRDREQQDVRRLLDHPNLRRVLLLTDVIGGERAQKVGDILASTPRRHATYVCLTIGPGVTVDPDRPGEASVFAVVVDENEEKALRQSLDKEFRNQVAELDARPETVTMLADVGQFAVLPGKAIANVLVPEDPKAALRNVPSRDVGLSAVFTPGNPAPLFIPPRTADELDVTENDPAIKAADPASPTPRSRREPRKPQPSVVLVWVQRPARPSTR